jgi:DNA-binding beta-propeller fold protein YncE
MGLLRQLTWPLLAIQLACDDGSENGSEACDSSSGDICTWAGTGEAGYDGGGNGRLQSMLYFPMGVTFSDLGKPAIADWNNHKIRVLEDDDTLTTVMGTEFVGDGPYDLADLEEPGAVGTTVNLNHPTNQIYMPDGTLLSASWHTHKLRTLDPDTGLVLVSLGAGAGFAGDLYEDASTALMNQPRDVAMDSQGNVYIVDMRNEIVRKLTPENTICTVVGNATQDFCGDGGAGRDACLNFPKSANPLPGGAIVITSDDHFMYIADTENHRIRRYDMVKDIITTIAGTGTAGYAGDGGAATDAELNFPRDMALLDDDTMLVADTSNHVIRILDLVSGTIDTFAGTGEMGFSGDGGPAIEATFNQPFHVEAAQDGTVYVSDTYNHRVRAIYE